MDFVRTSTCSMAAALSAIVAMSASSAIVIDTDNTDFVISGSQETREGNLATAPTPTGQTRYSTNSGAGSDRTLTIANSPSNTDFYINYSNSALGTLPISTYRYVEVYYSLSDDFVGSFHQLRLDTSDQSAAFDTFTNSADIESTAGSHSFIIDLLSDDGTTLAGTWSGDWDLFRWDFWNNNAGNEGKTFVLDKVVYASAVTVVPEPTSLALLGLSGLLIGTRRRRG